MKAWRGGAAALLVGLLAGCASPAPEPLPTGSSGATPLHYDYLTKLRLDVARIDVDSRWAPDGGRHVERLSPASPLQALRAMAEDRLLPVGGSGHATMTIDDASLIRDGDGYRGHFAVHVMLQAEDGRSLGGAVAQVSGTQPATGRSSDDLYALTHTLMDSMNVELEYQLQQSHLLQPLTPGGDAVPSPVQSQSLSPPPGVVEAAPVPLDPDAAGAAPTAAPPRAPPAVAPSADAPSPVLPPAGMPPAADQTAAPPDTGQPPMQMSPPPTSLGTVPLDSVPASPDAPGQSPPGSYQPAPYAPPSYAPAPYPPVSYPPAAYPPTSYPPTYPPPGPYAPPPVSLRPTDPGVP